MVVIAGDPTFRDLANHLVPVAEDWLSGDAARCICYPSQEDFADQGLSRRSLRHGPELRKAYKRLGIMAAQQLSASAPEPTIEIVPDIVIPS